MSSAVGLTYQRHHSNYTRRFFYSRPPWLRQHKQSQVCVNENGFLLLFLPWELGHASILGLRACFNAVLLPQPYWHQDHSEGADRVRGQMRWDKECPAVSGVTNSSRVWRKGAEKRYLECDWVPFAHLHRYMSPREGAVVLCCINCVSIPYVCGFQWRDTVHWLYGIHKTCARRQQFHTAPDM